LEPPVAGLTPKLTEALPRTHGTYGLGLYLAAPATRTIGALGDHAFPSGVYIYVGSAWGPGGLRARVGRHLRGSPKLRWHIDYLRRITSPIVLWLAAETHLECAWAQYLLAQPALSVIVPRFGASDCTCTTHLVYAGEIELQSIHLPGHPQFISCSG